MDTLSQRVSLRRLGKEQGILLAFGVFFIVVALNASSFMTIDNILAVLRQVTIVGVMALGVTFVVICGRLDLSIGSALSLTTVLMVDLHDKIGPVPAVIVTLMAGALIGVVNGTLVAYLNLNALITTLGMLSVLQGLTLVYTGGKNVNISHPDATWFGVFGRGHMAGIPTPIIIFVVLAVVLGVLLKRTSFGRQIYAVGGNEVASQFSGINAARAVFLAYVLSGVCVAVAAIIMASRVMGSQNNIGEGYELQVLAGVILGGTGLLGGSGSLFRSVVGVVILGFVQNGLLLLGFPYYVQWLMTWVVIIGAVWLDLGAKRGSLLV